MVAEWLLKHSESVVPELYRNNFASLITRVASNQILEEGDIFAMARDRVETSEVDWANLQDPNKVVYTIGIYGWRKRCLYFLILLIMILAIINLSLTIWILVVMDFNSDGMGKLRITDTGVKLYGHAEFVESLHAKEIRASYNKPLLVQSTNQLLVNARDGNGNITGQLYLGGDQVVAKNRYLRIKTDKDKEILYADKDKIIFRSDKLEFSSPYGAHFTGSVETPTVRSPPKQHLTLESLTQSLHMNAPEGISMETVAGGMTLNSLTNITMTSKGRITLNAKSISFKNLKSIAPGDINKACELCVNMDGSVFLGSSGCSSSC